MKTKAILLLVIGMIAMAALCMAQQKDAPAKDTHGTKVSGDTAAQHVHQKEGEPDKGAHELVIPGGTKGKVPFPHHKHQEALGTCNVCHDVFPQAAGSIEKLKAEGKLKKKQVMNKQCIKCHKANKKEGKKTGPLSCSQCHQ